MKMVDTLATIVAVIIAMVMVSCSENKSELESLVKPTWKQGNEVGMYSFNNQTFANPLTIKAEDKKMVEGTTPLEFDDKEMQKVAANSMTFASNYFDVKLTLTGNLGEPVSYQSGKTEISNITCTSTFSVNVDKIEQTKLTMDGYSCYIEGKIKFSLYVDGKYYTSCIQEFVIYQASNEEPKPAEPLYWIHIGNGKIGIVYDDDTMIEDYADVKMKAEAKKLLESDLSLSNAEENKEQETKANMFFKNNHWNNKIVVEGNIDGNITYKGETIPYGGGTVKTFAGDPVITTNRMDDYIKYEDGYIPYTTKVSNDEGETWVTVASCNQYFLVYKKKADEPADPKPLYWYQDVEKMIVVYDDESTEDEDNKISASTEDKSWTGDKDLEMTGNTSKPASKTMYFSTNYGNIKVNLSALIALGGDIDYDGHKIPCKSEFIVEAGTPVLVSNGKEGFDYHKVFNVPFVVKTKTNEEIKEVASCTSKVTISKEAAEITLVETIVNYIHKLFRTPIVNNQNITIVCDNSAVFTDVMSDKSEVKAGEVPYTVKHNFVVDGVLNFNVGNINEVANKSGYFTNGAFTIQGRNFSVTEVSSEVSEVTFRNKAYSAPMCVVTPYKWNTNDKGDTLTITFVDENGTPCATANIAMKVKVTTVIPYKVVSMVATDYFYALGDINNRKYRYAGTAIHCRFPDGSVFSFDIKKGVNSGVITKTGVVGNYAWYEVSQNNWELGLVTAEKVDEKNTDYCLRYYHLNAMNDGVIDAEKDKNLCAISLGNSEAVTSKTNYQYPIHNVTKNSDGTFTVSINNNGYNSDVVGTYNFASQN